MVLVLMVLQIIKHLCNFTKRLHHHSQESGGSITFRIGSETIQFQNGLSSNNRFDIVGITGSGVTPTDTSPTKNEYSLLRLSDGGSINN